MNAASVPQRWGATTPNLPHPGPPSRASYPRLPVCQTLPAKRSCAASCVSLRHTFAAPLRRRRGESAGSRALETCRFGASSPGRLGAGIHFPIVADAATGRRLPLRVPADPDRQSRRRVLWPATRPVVRGSDSLACGGFDGAPAVVGRDACAGPFGLSRCEREAVSSERRLQSGAGGRPRTMPAEGRVGRAGAAFGSWRGPRYPRDGGTRAEIVGAFDVLRRAWAHSSGSGWPCGGQTLGGRVGGYRDVPGRRRGDDAGMDPSLEDRPPARTVVLRVRLDDELPVGRAVAEDGRERSFTGWLGLMGVVGAWSWRTWVSGCPRSAGSTRLRRASPRGGQLAVALGRRAVRLA